MPGKFLLIGVILQLAGAVRVAGGDYGNGSFSATDRNSKSMNSEHNNADNCNIQDCLRCSSETTPETEEVRIICAECSGTKKLSPLKDACLTDCPAGTYTDRIMSAYSVTHRVQSAIVMPNQPPAPPATLGMY
ncbi:Kinesin-like protein KIF2 [Giardia duodenalis]|uniref:Kinesin-like protein KIF2 n=1 Tax=Giardia intestinalis TaxID=5741 RepID=V6TPZ9_GIAIN|nr:Kinesin-like protein KIF2 [Giardia intestinalis]